MTGKKVILLFYGSFLILSFMSIGLVAWLRTRPIVERQQREFGMVLGAAYQKYHADLHKWAPDAHEAAINFRSEKPSLLDDVKKAESDWGLKAEVRDPSSTTPTLILTFEKPQRQVLNTALRP